jgi:hypothetical protein
MGPLSAPKLILCPRKGWFPPRPPARFRRRRSAARPPLEPQPPLELFLDQGAYLLGFAFHTLWSRDGGGPVHVWLGTGATEDGSEYGKDVVCAFGQDRALPGQAMGALARGSNVDPGLANPSRPCSSARNGHDAGCAADAHGKEIP